MFTGSLSPIAPGETWIETCELRSEDDGSPVDLSGCDIAVRVRRAGCAADLLTAATGRGITLVQAGTFQVRFESGATQALTPGLYRVVAEVSGDGETDRILDCTLPVIGD